MYGDKFAEGEERGRWLVAWGRRKPDRQIWVAYGLIPLSYLVSYQGESAQGVLFAKEAYETTTELLGSDHPATQTAGTGLGFNLLWSGRFEDAEPVFAQSSRLSSRFALTRLRLLQGSMDPEDALPTIEEFVAETQPIQPQVWEVALTAQALCLVRLGRYEDAQQVMQRHPGKFMNAIAPNHYERRLYLNTLVEIYEGLDEPEKAAEYRALVRKAEQRDDAD